MFPHQKVLVFKRFPSEIKQKECRNSAACGYIIILRKRRHNKGKSAWSSTSCNINSCSDRFRLLHIIEVISELDLYNGAGEQLSINFYCAHLPPRATRRPPARLCPRLPTRAGGFTVWRCLFFILQPSQQQSRSNWNRLPPYLTSSRFFELVEFSTSRRIYFPWVWPLRHICSRPLCSKRLKWLLWAEYFLSGFWFCATSQKASHCFGFHC